jgi:pseudouridine-5'-phosphate glycosidase
LTQAQQSVLTVCRHKKSREWRDFRGLNKNCLLDKARKAGAALAGQADLGTILALLLALAFTLAFTLCLAVALACDVFAAGFAIGAAAGALVWAAAGVEITANGMARTAALARMDRNFFMGAPGV